MKITYMLSPTATYIVHTLASNVISENLINDKRIEVEFNNSIISNLLRIKKLRDKIDMINDDSSIAFYLKNSPNTNYLLSVVNANQKYFKEILESIKTDIVLVTCYNPFSLPFIKFLLDHGKKVVIGGYLCTAYTFDTIRNMVGNHKNLMIIKGYIDLKTDIFSIIKKWKDFEITKNDFKSMWYATKDHIKQNINIVKAFKGVDNPYNDFFYLVMFDNSCWYKNCTFCSIEDQKRVNFIEKIDKDELVESITLNLKQYKTNNLYIGNPFFTFNEEKRYILKELKKRGIYIAIATGIQLLMNRDYIDDMNEYIDEIRVGLESCSDFSLSYINKGYTWEDIKYAMENIVKNLSRSVAHRWLYISDLAENSREGVFENYKRLDAIKSRLWNYGFTFEWIPRHLLIFPDVEISNNTKYIKITKNSPNVSGIWAIHNYLSKYFEVNISESFVLPFERYDESGNFLPSDCDLVQLPPN